MTEQGHSGYTRDMNNVTDCQTCGTKNAWRIWTSPDGRITQRYPNRHTSDDCAAVLEERAEARAFASMGY